MHLNANSTPTLGTGALTEVLKPDVAVSSNFVLCLALLDVLLFYIFWKTAYKFYKETADIDIWVELES